MDEWRVKGGDIMSQSRSEYCGECPSKRIANIYTHSQEQMVFTPRLHEQILNDTSLSQFYKLILDIQLQGDSCVEWIRESNQTWMVSSSVISTIYCLQSADYVRLENNDIALNVEEICIALKASNFISLQVSELKKWINK